MRNCKLLLRKLCEALRKLCEATALGVPRKRPALGVPLLASEELIASNEELQSTNEELHSVNEELYTVNAEYQSKIQELTKLNNDMDNLLRSTEIGVVFLDRDLNIRKFTPAATQEINLREGDINRPLADVSHNLDYPDLIGLLKQVLISQEPLEQEMILRTSGENLLLRVHPYGREKGDCEGLVLSFVDIHEIKLTEERLRQRSEQLHLITDALPAGISYIDDQRCFRFNNKTYESWFGRSPQEIHGLHLRLVLGESTYEQVSTYVDRALAGENVSFDLELSNVENNNLWVNVNYIPHVLPSGKVQGFLALINNISERKAIEQMKDEFISVVSYEFRTPLTSIRATLQLLAEGWVEPDSEQGLEAIQIASKATERLVLLVNDILELERLESGKISLWKEPVNAADLIGEVRDSMQVIAAQKGITISVSAPEVECYADRRRIMQVLTNLVSNAIKFSPPNSTVELIIEPQEEEVLFVVKDEGRGIPADRLDIIFQRFQQIDSSDARQGGTGLGLAISRQIIAQHGGRIWVESTLGEGSTFYFTLSQLKDRHEPETDLSD